MRLIFFLFLFFLYSCSNSNSPKPEQKEKFFGDIKFSTEKNTFLSDISSPSSKEKLSNGNLSGYPINSLLWRASIDIVNNLPLEKIDPKSGVIITDWYEIPEDKNFRYKINIYFISPDLSAMSIDVSVIREKLSENIWINDGVSEELSNKIEDLILTRAKELRNSIN